jgi:serine/threonine protein phosphatase PrpC
MAAAIEVASLSRTGRRERNQDVVLTTLHPDGREATLVVCDGLGGSEHGERAAALAANAFMAEASRPEWRTALQRGIAAAQTAVKDFSARAGARSRPGTTLSGVLVRDGLVNWVSVGDTRAYVLSASGAKQISIDDSLSQLLVGIGAANAQETERSADRNVLTQAIGSDDVVPHFGEQFGLHPGDVLLVCTDGFWGTLSSHEIGALHSTTAKLHECLAQGDVLIQRYGRDDQDNYSAVLLRWTGKVRRTLPVIWTRLVTKGRMALTIAAALVAVLLVAMIVGRSTGYFREEQRALAKPAPARPKLDAPLATVTAVAPATAAVVALAAPLNCTAKAVCGDPSEENVAAPAKLVRVTGEEGTDARTLCEQATKYIASQSKQRCKRNVQPGRGYSTAICRTLECKTVMCDDTEHSCTRCEVEVQDWCGRPAPVSRECQTDTTCSD